MGNGWPDIVEKLCGSDSNYGGDYELLDCIQRMLLFISCYNDPGVQKWRARTNFSVEEIHSFLAFSENFIVNWTKELNTLSAACESVREQFSAENAMYLFIEIVNFSTPSECLKVMGVTVVDTPRLNMSDSETFFALRCMQDAAAILYLFDGNRQLRDWKKPLLR